jgi:hypothetical protein
VAATNGGTEDYSVQLLQGGLDMEPLQTYRVTFNASADQERSIMVQLEQNGGAWNCYSGQQWLGVNATQKTYSFDFTMNAPRDTNAQLEFNLGYGTIPVNISNVSVVKIDPSQIKKSAQPDGDLIYNGTFDEGANRQVFWNLGTSGGASATTSVGSDPSARQMTVNIAAAGTAASNISLYQQPFTLEKNQNYSLTFDASSTAARSITANLADGATTYGQQNFNLTNTMTTYTYNFTMSSATDPATQLSFYLGGNANAVTLDNVTLFKVAKTYPTKVLDPNANQIANGTFDTNDDYWIPWSDEGNGVYCSSYQNNGQLEVDVGNYNGVNPWDAQVVQNQLSLEEGQTYNLKFDAYATIPREMQVIVEQNGGSNTKYFVQNLNLTTNKQTFSYSFVPTANEPNAHLVLCLGPAENTSITTAHSVFFDNISMAKSITTTTNLAQGCQATASSVYTVDPQNVANNAVDGDMTTRWESAYSDPQWIYVDLNQNYNVNHVTLNWEGAFAKGYEIQTATTLGNWNTVYSTTTGDGNTDDITFAPVSARYVRVYCDTRNNPLWGDSIYEMQVFCIPSTQAQVATPTFTPTGGTFTTAQSVILADSTSGAVIHYTTDGSTPTASSPTYTGAIAVSATTTINAIAIATGMTNSAVATATYTINSGATNLALNKTATASSATQAASNAFDGNTGTRWESAYSDPQWLEVDLGSNQTVSSATLNWETAAAKAYSIQTSTDNTNWTTVYSETNGAGGIENVSFAPTTARYVRMYGTVRTTQYGYSLWEFSIYGGGAPVQQAATPTFTPAAGTFTSAQSVTLADSTSGAAIHYTTDGSTPTASSATYIGAIAVSATTTINAIAIATGMTNSAVASATYTINSTLTNLALNKTATASSSVQAASLAFDGNTGSRWESSASDPQWLEVDLGANCTVSGAQLNWETAAAKAYSIQVSTDNTNWTTVYSETTGVGGIENISFNAVTARYVRMYGTVRTTQYGYSLWEFQVLGTAGVTSTNLALGKTATASSVTGTNTASLAVDSDPTGTRWESAYSDPQWIEVDLGANHTITGAQLSWETAAAKAYSIQVSTDNTNWTTVYSESNGIGGVEKLSFTSVSARYVRMYGTARTTAYGYSLWDFEVLGS